MKRLKKLWAAARRRPFRALYALGACLLALALVGNFALDQLLYAAGLLKEKTVTLENTGQYTLVNMENNGGVLTSTTGDAQLLLNPGTLVRRLRLVARYEGEASAERTFITTCRALATPPACGCGPRRSRTAAGSTPCPGSPGRGCGWTWRTPPAWRWN